MTVASTIGTSRTFVLSPEPEPEPLYPNPFYQEPEPEPVAAEEGVPPSEAEA